MISFDLIHSIENFESRKRLKFFHLYFFIFLFEEVFGGTEL